MNVLVILRIVLGGLFLISGLGKLLEPYQNFLYVIQSYEFIPDVLEKLSAHAVPWLEFLAGVFLVLGFWLVYVLPFLLTLVASFLVIVSQAILRKLPINECGCFGELLSIPLPFVLLVDSILWIILLWLFIRKEQSSLFGLDHYFSRTK